MTTTVPVTSKLPDIGVSIFAVQTKLANEHKAINLSQGFPDFNCEPALVEAVAKAMRDEHNQYAPMPGVMALREAIAAKVEQLYGATFDPVTEVVVTSGATGLTPRSRHSCIRVTKRCCSSPATTRMCR